ncbi:MAG: MBOAT family protein [Chloroflexota bacterium]
MSFVSLEFAVLLALVLASTALIRNAFARKLIILAASCAFYAWWDWRFLGLLVFVTVLDYFISVLLVRSQDSRRRKLLLAISVASNLAILGFFKYFNFFVDTLNLALHPLGLDLPELQILLPIGISFYTFETLSYVIDVYRGHTEPAHSLVDYAVFVTFFPRLVAGPIMRASNFLPQLYRGLKFSQENFVVGAQYFAQGLLKKIVMADTCAVVVDKVYETPWFYSSSTVWLGVLAFAVQVYFDFSGYSDMATGVARMLGFELTMNFNLPYTSLNLTEFWTRWHISLSTWLRDYLYISLGGNRKGEARTYLNMFVTMLLGGLWHGASWNFVLWGGLHGIGMSLERWWMRDRRHAIEWKFWRGLRGGLLVFLWIALTCVFFRSPSLDIAGVVFGKLLFLDPAGVNWFYLPAFFYMTVVLFGGLVLRARNLDFTRLDLTRPYVLPFIVSEFLFVYLFAAKGVAPFIYFQF